MKEKNVTEDKITECLIENLKEENGLKLERPKEGKEYKSFEYDLCLKKSNDEVVALLEAKYRSNTGVPTTDSIITSLIKLIYEWCFTYNANKKIKLVFLIYLKNGVSEVKKGYRNSVLDKIYDLLKAFGNKIDPPVRDIINLKIEENPLRFINIDKFINKLRDYISEK